MSKTYKGYELLKAIADGEIKDGSRFRSKNFQHKIIYRQGILCIDNQYHSEISVMCYLNEEFELIEDEIDIQKLKEFEELDDDQINETLKKDTGMTLTDYDVFLIGEINNILVRQNTILKWAKQLDKKLEEKEQY